MLIKLKLPVLTTGVPIYPTEGGINKDSAAPELHHYCNIVAGKAAIGSLKPWPRVIGLCLPTRSVEGQVYGY